MSRLTKSQRADIRDALVSNRAALHLARTICRRAERRMVSLGVTAVDPDVLVYANRLSDLLFVMARVVNHRAGMPETEW